MRGVGTRELVVYGVAAVIAVMAPPANATAEPGRPVGVGFGTAFGGGIDAGALRIWTYSGEYKLPQAVLAPISFRIYHADRYLFEVDVKAIDWILTSALGAPVILVPTRHLWQGPVGAARVLGGIVYTPGVSIVSGAYGPLTVSMHRVGGAFGLEQPTGPDGRVRIGFRVQAEGVVEFIIAEPYAAAGFRLTGAFRIDFRAGREWLPAGHEERWEADDWDEWDDGPEEVPEEAPPAARQRTGFGRTKAEEDALRKASRLMDRAANLGFEEGDRVWVRHFCDAPTAGRAGEVAASLEDRGAVVSITRRDDSEKPWSVTADAEHRLRLSSLADARLVAQEVCETAGGVYDGWRLVD